MAEVESIQKYPENTSWAMKRIIDFIDEYASLHNLKNKEIKILDWGCGNGGDTLWLLNKGYDVYGVDIDEERITAGKINLENNGYSGERSSLLHDNNTNFEAGIFDIIFSKQVLEHVEDIDAVAREMKRLLSDRGRCFHIFPAKRHIVERHLFMPFVHWLPKNNLRKMLVILYTLIGIEPRWPGTDHMSNKEKARLYFNYSVNNTYYRSYKNIRKIFEKAGLNVQFNVLKHPKLQEITLIKLLLRQKFMKDILEYLLLTFISIEIVTSVKRDS